MLKRSFAVEAAMEYDERDYLALSGIQHFAFCRRQWALIHIEQEWEDNLLTTTGSLMHERAHNEELHERRGGTIISRGLRIHSRRLGVTGQCDVVEFHSAACGCHLYGEEGVWEVIPVEFKRGRPKDFDADRLQLCAQAICLEDMLGSDIAKGFLYYGTPKRREPVEFDDELRRRVELICMEMHETYKRHHVPKVKQGKKCRSCSLVEVCMPKSASPGQRVPVDGYIDKMLHSGDGVRS